MTKIETSIMLIKSTYSLPNIQHRYGAPQQTNKKVIFKNLVSLVLNSRDTKSLSLQYKCDKTIGRRNSIVLL